MLIRQLGGSWLALAAPLSLAIDFCTSWVICSVWSRLYLNFIMGNHSSDPCTVIPHSLLSIIKYGVDE